MRTEYRSDGQADRRTGGERGSAADASGGEDGGRGLSRERRHLQKQERRDGLSPGLQEEPPLAPCS